MREYLCPELGYCASEWRVCCGNMAQLVLLLRGDHYTFDMMLERILRDEPAKVCKPFLRQVRKPKNLFCRFQKLVPFLDAAQIDEHVVHGWLKGKA